MSLCHKYCLPCSYLSKSTSMWATWFTFQRSVRQVCKLYYAFWFHAISLIKSCRQLCDKKQRKVNVGRKTASGFKHGCKQCRIWNTPKMALQMHFGKETHSTCFLASRAHTMLLVWCSECYVHLQEICARFLECLSSQVALSSNMAISLLKRRNFFLESVINFSGGDNTDCNKHITW